VALFKWGWEHLSPEPKWLRYCIQVSQVLYDYSAMNNYFIIGTARLPSVAYFDAVGWAAGRASGL